MHYPRLITRKLITRWLFGLVSKTQTVVEQHEARGNRQEVFRGTTWKVFGVPVAFTELDKHEL